ncbi:MAG: hypothetical protein Athens101428_473 [Candidatus Berkelbacteria bacterium Athens1014_28]|uniref:Uncharacterized protein n=1 Tax=Candidatus Berkelbacteria bacterium Athens1014_28 TaxID=2017145 RepID=A0A554LM31_9BACT|nr:MAG: hypothetical protein Athens101428_473 [Candidatus Berkelbacteria bacterium Athens1014_28]
MRKPRIISPESSAYSKFSLVAACRINAPKCRVLKGNVGNLALSKCFIQEGRFRFPNDVCVSFAEPINVWGRSTLGEWIQLDEKTDVGFKLEQVEIFSLMFPFVPGISGFLGKNDATKSWGSDESFYLGISVWDLIKVFGSPQLTDIKDISFESTYQMRLDYLRAVCCEKTPEVVDWNIRLSYGLEYSDYCPATFGKSLADLRRAVRIKKPELWYQRTINTLRIEGIVRDLLKRDGEIYLVIEGKCESYPLVKFMAVRLENILSGLIGERMTRHFI